VGGLSTGLEEWGVGGRVERDEWGVGGPGYAGENVHGSALTHAQGILTGFAREGLRRR
jgi:hypothetical protein